MRIHRPGDRHRTLWSSVRRCRRRGVGGRVKVSGRNAVKRGRGNCCQNETPFARGEGSGAGVVERTRSRHIASSPSYVPQGDPARFRPLAHKEANRARAQLTAYQAILPLALFFAVDTGNVRRVDSPDLPESERDLRSTDPGAWTKLETDQHISDHPYPQTEASASLRSPQTEAPAT